MFRTADIVTTAEVIGSAPIDMPPMAAGIDEGFDAILCAGNVMTFLAPSTRTEVLTRMGRHLREGGRIAVGFGAGRGYEFDAFRADCAAAGLIVELELGSWDLRPFTPDSGFLVALLGRR